MPRHLARGALDTSSDEIDSVRLFLSLSLSTYIYKYIDIYVPRPFTSTLADIAGQVSPDVWLLIGRTRRRGHGGGHLLDASARV